MKTHLTKSALSYIRYACKINGEVPCIGLASNCCTTFDVFNRHFVVFNMAFERSVQVRQFIEVIFRVIDYD